MMRQSVVCSRSWCGIHCIISKLIQFDRKNTHQKLHDFLPESLSEEK